MRERIDGEYEIEAGSDSSKQYSQIWIRPRRYREPSLYYGMESFSGRGGFDGLFIGIFNPSGKRPAFDRLSVAQPTNAWWANVRKISALDGYDAHLGNARTLRKLYQDALFRKAFIAHLVGEVEQYLSAQRSNLEHFLSTEAR